MPPRRSIQAPFESVSGPRGMRMRTRARRLCRSFASAFVILQLVTAAAAHDSWLIADANLAAPGDNVWLSFVTGEVFPLGEKSTHPDRVASFVQVHDGRTIDVTGYKPQDKGLSLRRPIEGGGLHVFGIALKPQRLTMERDKFEAYLHEEGDERAAARFAQDTTSGPITEEYTKFAKTMIEVSPADPARHDHLTPLGHRLEIIPMTSPCHWSAGATVRVQVLLDGHPWSDVPVCLGHESLAEHGYLARQATDAQGIASFTLDKPGHGFVKAHLVRPRTGLGKGSWESFWASLSFRVIGKDDAQPALRAIKALHGSIEPWAVVGYRAGSFALQALALPFGSPRLHAVVRIPAAAPYAAIADGIQAATQASAGRLNLAIEPAEFSEMQVTFVDRETGGAVRLRPILETLQSDEDPEAFALRVCTWTEQQLFEMSMASVPTSPPAVVAAGPRLVSSPPTADPGRAGF
jgi:uncharacterized GH25 family protein